MSARSALLSRLVRRQVEYRRRRLAARAHVSGVLLDCHEMTLIQEKMMAKKNEELDPETLALINWCIEVEGFLVAGGATLEQAQEHIEEQVEWFTDHFYDGLTPEQAAKEALA